MIAAIRNMLRDMGYAINESAYSIIETCDDWYRARATDAHKRYRVNGDEYQLERMGFGGRAAADDANLCEVIEINAGGKNQAQFEFTGGVLKNNRFDTQYRKQLELTAAEGTTACYVWIEDADQYEDGSVKGGQIRLNYTNALGFVPLTVKNDEVIEAAFVGENFVGTEIEHTAVVCLRVDGVYCYFIRVFDKNGELIPDKSQDVQLGTVKPFAVMRTAQVNTLDDMDGFGKPKLLESIPVLYGLDAAFTALTGDLEASEKITLINEMLCSFDEKGKPIKPNEQMKRQFVMLGEKLPQSNDVIHEINPEIRIEVFQQTIEFLLNLLSQQFGYGTKKYSFDRTTGSVTTATEYIGERQDMLQELNRQRHDAKEYITGIVRAILWFANAYQGGSWDENVDVLVEFDDSYIVNKAEELESIRADVIAGIGGAHVRKLYLMQKYNLDEKEAAKWAAADDPDAGQETED